MHLIRSFPVRSVLESSHKDQNPNSNGKAEKVDGSVEFTFTRLARKVPRKIDVGQHTRA